VPGAIEWPSAGGFAGVLWASAAWRADADCAMVASAMWRVDADWAMASATVRADADDGWSSFSNVLLRRGMGCISTWFTAGWLAASLSIL